MRITVWRVLGLLAAYEDRAELFRDYPYLEEEDIKQALAYAAAAIDDGIHNLNLVA